MTKPHYDIHTKEWITVKESFTQKINPQGREACRFILCAAFSKFIFHERQFVRL